MNVCCLQITDLEHELRERASDFIVAGSMESLDDLEGMIASQHAQIQELE